MLVVPGLSWPILFGQNHLRQTKAITDHVKLIIYFNHPSLCFQIKCVDSNPFAHFPNLSNQTFSSVKVHTSHACLQEFLLPPSKNIVLKCGFNLATLCLVMDSSFVGNPFFANQLLLEGSQLVPGVQILSGLIELKSLGTSSSLTGFPNFIYLAITTQNTVQVSYFQNPT